jgi:hypothetical protein
LRETVRIFWLDASFVPQYNRHKSAKKEETPVTVCVAAMFGGNAIIGASDRMLTSGDIQFEPQQQKIINLTSSIAIMVAGDSSMQAEIIQNVQADVSKRIEAEPQNWWNVKDVAELYSYYYDIARFTRAEKQILTPLGLNGNTFISRQKEMDTELIRQLSTELKYFVPPSIAAIFAGVDNSGAHIYLSNNGNLTCQDLVGFAAIGIGSWHANSQMMFAGHTKWKPLPETLLLVYSAKKRAEVAPGVGEATDMFMVGAQLGSYFVIHDDVLKELKKIYIDEQARERRAANKANESVTRYLDRKAKATASTEQATVSPDSGGETPSSESGD